MEDQHNKEDQRLIDPSKLSPSAPPATEPGPGNLRRVGEESTEHRLTPLSSVLGASRALESDASGMVDPLLVMQKLRLRVLPLMMFIVVLCYFDRTNLAFAAVPLNRDLGFNTNVYGLGSGLFFIGYALFQVPSNMVLVAVGPHRWLAIITVLWGFVACFFTAMRNAAEFYVLRFLLGAAEAGAFPGIYFYLTLFFPRCELSIPYAAVEASILISHTLSAPLAAGILAAADSLELNGWQALFLVEGAASVLLGVVLWLALAAGPAEIRSLLPQEKAWLQQRLQPKEEETLEPQAQAERTQWDDLRVTLCDGCVWYIGVLKMLKDIANYGVFFFTPMIIKSILHGTSHAQAEHDDSHDNEQERHNQDRANVHAVLLTAVPYSVAALASIAIGWSSQRFCEKPFHIAVPYAVAGVALVLFPAAVHVPALGLMVLTIAVSGIYGANAVTVSLLAGILADRPVTTATSFALYNAVGNLGGFVGPFIVGNIVESTGSYAVAMVVLGCCIGTSSLMAVWTRTWPRVRPSQPTRAEDDGPPLQYSRLQDAVDLELAHHTPDASQPLRKAVRPNR